jgi:hypothetical protein
MERTQDMPNRGDLKRMELRLEDDLYNLLKGRAEKNGRTLHGEITLVLRKSIPTSRRKDVKQNT